MQQKIHLEDFMKEVIGAYPFSPVIMEAFKFIFNNQYESIIIVNKKGKIEYIDRLSEKVFKVPHGQAVGRDIKEIIPNSELPNIVLTGKHDIGKTLSVLGRQRIISRFPLVSNGQIIGAFGRVLLHSLDELERVREEAKILRTKVIDAEEKMIDRHQATYTFDHILGKSPLIVQAKEFAKKIADSDRDVLIYGESGSGKELFAHAIHNESRRRSKPFVKVNCPAIPIDIAESELFGYERGAFTGADRAGKAGKFEQAQGGTIFLDEIGSLPMSIQAKLLRVIQEREMERLGSQKLIRLDMRLIAVSNTNLKKMAKQGKFRDDFLFRLSKAILQIPPLRDRPEDIPVYLNTYLRVLNKSIGTRVKSIANDARKCLMTYSWPGNVRELINVLEQSLFKVGMEKELTLGHLPDDVKQQKYSLPAMTAHASLKTQVEQLEKDIILKALQDFSGNKRKTAQQLGIQRSALYIKLKKYGLDRVGM